MFLHHLFEQISLFGVFVMASNYSAFQELTVGGSRGVALTAKHELVPRGSISPSSISALKQAHDPTYTHTLQSRRKESLYYEITCFAEQMAKLHAERDFGLKTGKGPNPKGFDIPNAQPLLDGIRQRYLDVRLGIAEEVEVQRCLSDDYQTHYQTQLKRLYRTELGTLERWGMALKEMLGI